MHEKGKNFPKWFMLSRKEGLSLFADAALQLIEKNDVLRQDKEGQQKRNIRCYSFILWTLSSSIRLLSAFKEDVRVSGAVYL